MPKPKPALTPDATTTPGYRPPQKLLVPCALCTMTVLRGTYDMGSNRYDKAEPLLDPIEGEPHNCDEALAQWLHVMRQRWQELWIFGAHWNEWKGGTQGETSTPAPGAIPETGVYALTSADTLGKSEGSITHEEKEVMHV